MFYAIQWTYGRASNPDGTRCGSYYSFDSASERDEWCNAGNPYVTQPGARESISGSDGELRRLLRQQRGANRTDDLRVMPIDLARQIETGV